MYFMGPEICMLHLYFTEDWELKVVVTVAGSRPFSCCVDRRSEEGEHHHIIISLYLKILGAFFSLEV